MMLMRVREAEIRRGAERYSAIGGDGSLRGRRRHRRASDSPSTGRLLVSKTCELVRLADSLGYKRDELVRMIQSVP